MQYYIEQYRQLDKTKTVFTPLQTIDRLQNGLKLTKASNCVTIAVFKITPKPGVIIASYDNELKTTIVENATI